MTKSKTTEAKWLIYRSSNDGNLCKRCNNMIDRPFLAKEGLSSVPFHPNCECKVESYQQGMTDYLKRESPALSSAQISQLMTKEYYRHMQVAIPTQIDGDYHYYVVNDKTYKINIATLHGVGLLPNGKYIVGATNEAKNSRHLDSIISGTAEAAKEVIGINIPLQNSAVLTNINSQPIYQDGDRRTITYFGEQYHGQVINGELYLDETCQRDFLKQLEFTIHPWQWSRYKDLSVSEAMAAAPKYKTGWKPYDPSKPLPTLSEDYRTLMNMTEIPSNKGITANILLSEELVDGGNITRLRFVDSLDAGNVTVTDYYIAVKPSKKWKDQVEGPFNTFMDITDMVSVAAEVDDPTILMSGAPITVPLKAIGEVATVANFLGSEFPPEAIAQLDRLLKSLEENKEGVVLIYSVVGYDATFDKYGNLRINYSYKYSIF